MLGFCLHLRADLTLVGEGTYEDKSSAFTLHLSGGKVQMQGEMASVILIPQENKMIVVLPQQQAYMEKTLDISGKDGSLPTGLSLLSPPTVTHTGKKEMINGFECEQVIVKMAGGITTEFWFSPQGPSIADALPTLQLAESQNIGNVNLSWVRFLASTRDFTTFPIQAMMRDTSGVEQVRFTIKSVSKDPIAPAIFAPPPGFFGVQMPSFGMEK